MIADASAAPVQRNANTMPNHSSSRLPIGPRLPSRTSSAKPTTTGGSTSGRWTIASKSVLPGNEKRASTYATTIAIGRLASTLTSATRRLSARMPTSSGPSPNIGYCANPKPCFSHTARAGADRRYASNAGPAGDLLPATSATG